MIEVQADEGEPDDTPDYAALYVKWLVVRDFRGLKRCAIQFEPDLTIIVGPNNSGKSRLLRALAIALGAATPERDDLTVGTYQEAVIDVVLAPRPPPANADGDNETQAEAEAEENAGPTDSPAAAEEVFSVRTARRIGSAVQTIQEEPPIERFAWRTTIRQSLEGFGVRGEQTTLVWDVGAEEWTNPTSSTRLSAEQRLLVAADLVNTGRDLVKELGQAGSAVRRVLDDLEIEVGQRTELESKLQALGTEIVGASAALRAITGALADATASGLGKPSVSPLPPRLEELARSVSIDLDSGAGGALPVRLHGSGTRSVASLQIQRVLYDRRLGRDGRALRPHPVSLIEEPEAHLHPQAQFDLPRLLTNIAGQVIVSSHSSHLTSVLDPGALRILQRSDAGLRVVDLKPDATSPLRARRPELSLGELEKLRRQVERPFGELLFASAVVLGDGATERSLFPPLIQHALGVRGQAVCVVDPGSMNQPLAEAVVKFAAMVGIPWLLFADSDQAGQLAARNLDLKYGNGDEKSIVWVQPPTKVAKDKGAATEQILIEFDEHLCEEAAGQIGFDPSKHTLKKFMKSNKGIIGSFYAAALISKHPCPPEGLPHWPGQIVELISTLDQALPRGEESK